MNIPFLPLLNGHSAFCKFLKKNYGYTDVRPFSPHRRFATSMNSIYLAKDAEGKTIFIKACRYADMSENEYRSGLELWQQAPEHFAKPLAYHAGEPFSFCSAEYVPGKDLISLLQSGEALTGEQKAQIVEDIYTIYQALKRANIVHRDADIKNMLYRNGRVVLIDCQLATKPINTKSVTFFNDIFKICASRWFGKISMKLLEWDDAVRLLIAVRKVGCSPEHQERFDFICSELEKALGTFVYTYPYPSMEELQQALRKGRFLSRFHHQSKMRHRYRCVVKQLEFFKQHHPDTK